MGQPQSSDAWRSSRGQKLVSGAAVLILTAGSAMGTQASAGEGAAAPLETEESGGGRCDYSYTDADWYTRDGVGSPLIDFRDRDFRDCDLSGAVLRFADFSGSDFSAANLSGADFGYGFFNDATLVDTDLSGTLLHGVDFSGADLTGADLSGSTRIYASFSNAVITDCIDCTQTVPPGSDSIQPEQIAQDVEVRDQLIAAQEALLDAYRCRFDIATETVPGGCIENGLAPPRVQPPPFAAVSTGRDIESRDRLTIALEAWLPAYRSRFATDTEVVPGGCPYDPVPDPPLP